MQTNIPQLWALDYVYGLLIIIIIYFFATIYKSHKYETDSTYQYFIPALSAKIIGGIGFLFLSIYYWKSGDTFTYYDVADGFSIFMLEEPLESIKLLFSGGRNINWSKYDFAYGHYNLLKTTRASFTIVKITALINLFCLRSYVATTIIFSFLSFIGVWNMYYTFCKVYPHLKKPLLLAFFFIPSVILWGSGILKDTITIAAIGWIIYSYINIILLKRKKLLSIILIVLSTYILALLKPYILYVLYPTLFIWFQSNLKEIIHSDLLRNILAPFIAIIIIISSYFLIQQLSKNTERYNLNKLEDTLEGFQSWHTTVSETKNQSGYTLGDMDFSPIGLIKKVPAAINVTFFRPYLWEIRNASTILGALEALLLTLYSLWLVLRYRIQLFRLIYKNKDILFLMFFSLIFGAVVGISSYNFGALSRYKMPAQMFYVISLILIHDKTLNNEKRNSY